MTCEDGIRVVVERAGYRAFRDAFDTGILRVIEATGDPLWSRKVVGIVVIRDEKVTYAEHKGQVFGFWRTVSYSASLALYEDFVKANPA